MAEVNVNQANGVNGTLNTSRSASLGRVAVGQQAAPGRHQATARREWGYHENKMVMECYLKSMIPVKRGYRKRMHALWKDMGGFDLSEQRLADQVRQIKVKGWLSDLEIEEIKRKVHGPTQGGSSNDINPPDDVSTALQEDNEPLERTQDYDAHWSQDSEDSLSCEDHLIVSQLVAVMQEPERKRLPALRSVQRSKLMDEVAKVNDVMRRVRTSNITETNNLVYAAAFVVTERLGIKIDKNGNKKEPMWKQRLERQLRSLRQDLSRIKTMKEGRLIKRKVRDYLEKKYRLKTKTVEVVIEELKQRIVAIANRIKRYSDRIKQYQQNRMFNNNQSRLYDTLERKSEREEVLPDTEESKKFWSDIWSEPVQHNREAEWLKKLKEEIEVEQQEDIKIDIEKLRKVLMGIPNWKAPGPDMVQGFWIKNFTSIHARLVEQLSMCLECGQVPLWMTKGRTVLIMKDEKKGSIPSNFRPITCLPLMWKLLTGVITTEVYGFIEDMLPQEQKGCRKNSRGTHDLLFIDKMILRNARRNQKNLVMAWVDYRKAYDLVPHSWIQECLDLFGIATNVKRILINSMNNWNTLLSSGNISIGQIDIKRGIFQGDTLSPLLFVIALIPLTLVLRKTRFAYNLNGEQINHLLFMDDLKLFAKSEKGIESLIHTVRVFSSDIGMHFGIDKCATLVLHRGKTKQSNGISLPTGKDIESLDENAGYRYLGILESDNFKNKEMKTSITKEYLRRVRKLLKSKLNGGNVIKAINTWAVSLLRYSAPFVDWTKEELSEIDRKTRKYLNMNRALHPRDSVARLYLPRQIGGRGLISVKDCSDQAKLGLMKYIQNSQESILIAARGEMSNTPDEIEDVKEFKKRKTEERMQEYSNKELHGQFIREVKDVSCDKSWVWLRDGNLKKETESLIISAQTQSIRTNLIKTKIDKSQDNPKCRLCHQKDESVNHILCECTALAQKEYRKRHDGVAKALHWDLCRAYGLEHAGKWYEHKPEPVIENQDVKILWDFTIQTDKKISHNRPDIVLIDKRNSKCQIIDVACPGDKRIQGKEIEKIEKYTDLAVEIQRLWKMKSVKVVPIVIGVLGMFTNKLEQYLKDLKASIKVAQIQRTVLLGSARILRRILSV